MTGQPQPRAIVVPQKPCSAPPKRRPAAYHHRPRQAPGQTRAHHRSAADPQPIRVIVPAELPELTPAAALALLRILRAAQPTPERDDREERR